MQKNSDPMGTAIMDYLMKGKASRLRVLSPDFDEDEIPVETLFREFDEMPEIEKNALELAQGRILDVGAGSGCHSLELQRMGKQVVAIDLSELSVEAMKRRGVENACVQDFYKVEERYDTVLLLMNGSGIIGGIDKMKDFFSHLDNILCDGGVVLMDSSDISYVSTDDDGVFDYSGEGYYGELTYTMRYKNIKGEPFKWLYLDFETLKSSASKYGYSAELILEGDHFDYLAKITKQRQ